jgi:hypothetical protein
MRKRRARRRLRQAWTIAGATASPNKLREALQWLATGAYSSIAAVREKAARALE